MSRGTKLRRSLGVLVAAIAALAMFSPAGTHAAEKSFSLPSLDTTAIVSADGSMQVTEVITYDFSGGPFNFGIRSFTKGDDRNRITDFTAADEQGPLTVIPPDASVSGEWEWQLRGPTSDQRITYTLTYRVPGAVTIHADVADLYWQFVGNDHPGIGRMHVSVVFPAGIPAAPPDVADDDATVLRAFAHGPSNGVIRVAESTADATVTDVPAGEFVELRVLTPATAYAVSGSGTALASILADERSYVTEREDAADRRRLGWVLTPVLGGLGLLGTAALWITGGREKKSTEVLGDYWREPLDEPPAVALANLNRGTIEPNATIAGTIVDLAQRGYLRIVGTRHERFGPDKTVHEFHWLGKPTDDLLGYERDVLELVFRGQNVSNSDELTEWAKKHQTEARSLLTKVKSGVTRSYTARKYEQKANPRQLAILFAVCAVVAAGSVGLKFYSHNGFAWVGVGLAVACFVAGSKVLGNRTRAGVEAAAKAAGLKKFLKDFSRLEDAPVGHLILWERFLVFAVALGVSHELIQGLSARLPALMADPNFGVWYVGPYGRWDGFDQIQTTTAASYVTASTPNSSGSGGGFSGGGGGGGGGGGFGAR